jgi:hypothetical protein
VPCRHARAAAQARHVRTHAREPPRRRVSPHAPAAAGLLVQFAACANAYCSRSVRLTRAWMARTTAAAQRGAARHAGSMRALCAGSAAGRGGAVWPWAIQPLEVRGRDDVPVADGRDRDDRPAGALLQPLRSGAVRLHAAGLAETKPGRCAQSKVRAGYARPLASHGVCCKLSQPAARCKLCRLRGVSCCRAAPTVACCMVRGTL